MNTVFYEDVESGLGRIQPRTVQTCVTSPPYWRLRQYGHSRQIGQEATIEEYVRRLVHVFRAVRRVLRPDGTLWLNLGDTFASRWASQFVDMKGRRWRKPGRLRDKRLDHGLPDRSLCGIPWRVALALQADGWRLRCDIVWAKTNGAPESAPDRPSRHHEYVFLFSKEARYFYDRTAIARRPAPDTEARRRRGRSNVYDRQDRPHGGIMSARSRGEDQGSQPLVNTRSVWPMAVTRYKGAHFSTFPAELARRCILAGTSAAGACRRCGAPMKRIETRRFVPQRDVSLARAVRGAPGTKPTPGRNWTVRGTNAVSTHGWRRTCRHNGRRSTPQLVLDPFAGSGTTLAVANELGRAWVGVEIVEANRRLIEERIRGKA